MTKNANQAVTTRRRSSHIFIVVSLGQVFLLNSWLTSTKIKTKWQIFVHQCTRAMGLIPYKLYTKIRQYIPNHGYYVNQKRRRAYMDNFWDLKKKVKFFFRPGSLLPHRKRGRPGHFSAVHVLLSRFLSRFYPDFIQILSWFYLAKIWIKSGSNSLETTI